MIKGKVNKSFDREIIEKFWWDKWEDFYKNPVISPPYENTVVGEPSIILPSDSPDGKWHLFTVSGDTYINHMVSSDGINWEITDRWKPGWNPFVFKEKDTFYMFHHGYWFSDKGCSIVMRYSKDLVNWSKDELILEPELSWEKEEKPVVRNACVLKLPDGKFRLYYAAGYGFLKECEYSEPLYVSFAESEDIKGPYKKFGQPIIFPNKKDKYRNFGAGGLKVYFERKEKILVGLNNGIYYDEEGKARSSLHLLLSKDGIEWYEFPFNPIIYPEEGWKRAFVYQVDLKRVNNELWLYYNARDGWKDGVERIGISIYKLKDFQDPLF